MANTKRILSGLTALAIVGGLAACTSDSGSGEAETTTTTQKTVAINTETLSAEDAGTIDEVASSLEGELENKTIKWFSFYDPFHATTSGNTKALSLELFESRYGGEIEYVETTWANRFNDLSTKIIGGDGVDFIAGSDLDSFPRGVPAGQYQAFDEYIDWSNPLWAEQKKLNDMFELNGKHYNICLNATVGQVVYYNRNTIETLGYDDPADLLEAGNWNWDTFKGMLLDFCDEEAGQYGLDGWFNEQPLMLTCGVPSVEMKNGRLVHNLYDANLERVMNFMQGLNTSGLVLDKSLFGWSEHPEFVGEGRELFYIGGMYIVESAPEIWTETFGKQEDVMFVPMPKDPQADKYYLPAGLEAYLLCKGAQNPEGVMRFMECIMAANSDERTQEIALEKRRNDYGWTEEMIGMQAKIADMSRENPVYDLHAGVQLDLYNILDSGQTGIRAAFEGNDWATVRESITDAVELYVDEFNSSMDQLS